MYNSKEYHHKYYLDNKEKIIERTKIRYKNKKEEISEYLKEYTKRPYYKKKHSLYQKKWYKKKKIEDPTYFSRKGRERNEYKRIYTKNYRNKNRAWYLSTKNRRRCLEKKGNGIMESDISKKLIQQNNKCFYCGIDIEKTYTIDHAIPLFRGGKHDKDNFDLVCKICNSKKHTKTKEEYLEYMKVATDFLQ